MGNSYVQDAYGHMIGMNWCEWCRANSELEYMALHQDQVDKNKEGQGDQMGHVKIKNTGNHVIG